MFVVIAGVVGVLELLRGLALMADLFVFWGRFQDLYNSKSIIVGTFTRSVGIINSRLPFPLRLDL